MERVRMKRSISIRSRSIIDIRRRNNVGSSSSWK
jgi:hypothetical protein